MDGQKGNDSIIEYRQGRSGLQAILMYFKIKQTKEPLAKPDSHSMQPPRIKLLQHACQSSPRRKGSEEEEVRHNSYPSICGVQGLE